MKTNEKGFLGAFVALILVAIVIGFFVMLFSFQASFSDQNVSGIVYNTKNNQALTGNTNFSVRAGVDTYVSNENESSYCLPPHSPYIAVVNKAAADKRVKVVVTTKKFFKIGVAPWTCVPNVTVKEVK